MSSKITVANRLRIFVAVTVHLMNMTTSFLKFAVHVISDNMLKFVKCTRQCTMVKYDNQNTVNPFNFASQKNLAFQSLTIFRVHLNSLFHIKTHIYHIQNSRPLIFSRTFIFTKLKASRTLWDLQYFIVSMIWVRIFRGALTNTHATVTYTAQTDQP